MVKQTKVRDYQKVAVKNVTANKTMLTSSANNLKKLNNQGGLYDNEDDGGNDE